MILVGSPKRTGSASTRRDELADLLTHVCDEAGGAIPLPLAHAAARFAFPDVPARTITRDMGELTRGGRFVTTRRYSATWIQPRLTAVA